MIGELQIREEYDWMSLPFYTTWQKGHCLQAPHRAGLAEAGGGGGPLRVVAGPLSFSIAAKV